MEPIRGINYVAIPEFPKAEDDELSGSLSQKEEVQPLKHTMTDAKL